MSSIKHVYNCLSEIEQNILNELGSYDATVLRQLQNTTKLLKQLPLYDVHINTNKDFKEVESFWQELKTSADSSDYALNNLKSAVKIVENLRIIHDSAIKLISFFKNDNYHDISGEIERYIHATELSKSSGHWDDILRVLSNGYIGKDLASLRQITLDKLRSNMDSHQSHILTRLAMALGAEKEVYDTYLSSIRIETGSILDTDRYNIVAGGEHSALRRVTENARNLLLGQAAVVHLELGGVYYIKICREIHNSASIDATRIFIGFIKSKISPFINDIYNDNSITDIERFLQNSSVKNVNISDMTKLEAVLDDIAGISSLWLDFEAALSEVTKPVYKTLFIKNEDRDKFGDDGLTKLSSATKLLQSLFSIYVKLEHTLVTKAVHQAVEVADTIYLSPDELYHNPTSTVVDDIFFVLQKSQLRAIGTGDIQAACATFNQVASVISNDLRSILMHNLIESQKIYEKWTRNLENLNHGWYDMLEDHFKNMKQPLPETVDSRYSFIHCLNNVEECLNLLVKFQDEMNEYFKNEFARGRHNKTLLIENTIQTLDLVRNEYEDIRDTTCKYALNILKEHITEPLNSFSRIDFCLDEESYSSYQDDEFIVELVRILEIVFKHIDHNYAPSIGLMCITRLVERICQYIESSITTRQFTIYGAIRLDIIIRSLFSTCSSLDPQIRKQFNLLFQIIDVLNVNSKTELILLKDENKGFDVEKYALLRIDL